MTHLTLPAPLRLFNVFRGWRAINTSYQHKLITNERKTHHTMLTPIIVTAAVVGALGYAFRSGRSDGIINRRPYNNRHSDASGARDLIR